jgi:tRNA threonylcarbamoyladenosine biosynthesis protein TsaE
VRQSSAAVLNVGTPDDMRAIGGTLGRALSAAGAGALVIAIEGDLGTGKTTLVGGVLAGLGLGGAARSPTYTLIEPYEAAGRQLYHIDLYRLGSAREVEALGLRDLLTASSVLLIEWPSRAAAALPPADLDFFIEYVPGTEQGRVLTLRAGSSAGHQLVEQILAETSE